MEMLISFSSRTWHLPTLPKVPKAGSIHHTVLDWPANSPDLNPIENLWAIVKRKLRDTRPNNANDLKAVIKATWASVTPEQCHRLIVSMPRCIDAVILLHIHYITGSHHTGTWLLLPLLCWWHTALSLITTRWSNGSCTDLRLPGRHLGMDERKPSTAKPGKDWASCLPCNSNSTAWFHDSVRYVYNYPISFGQKSWCNLRWPADLQRAHCKDCSILQVCTTQHQKDQALSDRACCTTSCPGPCHF